MERKEQMMGLGMLIGAGLLLTIVPFVFKNPFKVWGCWAFGLSFLGIAAFWIFTDKRVLTEEEEVERLLIEASRRFNRTGSMASLFDEYRNEGASDLTLGRISNAHEILCSRARERLRTGLILSGAGLLCVCASIAVWFWKSNQPELHLLKYGFLGAGAGLGHVCQGLRLHWHGRRFKPSMSAARDFSRS
jgi:hypothetical protein